MRSDILSALKITAFYAAFAGIWILFSDLAVSLLVQDQQTITLVQTLKGWFFVGVTGALLFVLVARSLDRVRQAYDLDSLTGLMSYAAFKAQLARLASDLPDHQVLVVCYLDIDGFHKLNQAQGGELADTFLQALAADLNSQRSVQDILCRLPPDQFAMARRVPKQQSVADQALAVERLFRGTCERFGLALTCSMGVATFPGDSDSPKDLLDAASAALKEAKRATNRICFHNKQLAQAERDRWQMLEELRAALDQGALSLVYQPKYHADTRAVAGLEVLVRWRHPQRGFISPAQFVPIAEENGLSLQLTEFVIARAASELAATGLLGGKVQHVAINVSATEFNSEQAMQQLYACIQAHPALAPCVRIEITETATLTDIPKSSALISKLRDKGLSFSVDDFGTGYTSLAMLKDFTIDEIKIDRSFVAVVDTDSRARTIVRAVIAMAANFNIDVVAEGVETAAQLRTLQSMGCKQVQGYYLAHPMPVATLLEHLNRDVLTS